MGPNTETDYNGYEVQLTNNECDFCGKQLNKTEVTESQTHMEGKLFCTDHLNQVLEGVMLN